MMFSGFNADYEASSSRCSSASPAGDNLSYYHSPADSFSSMGSPVNAQVSLPSCSRRVSAEGRRGMDTGMGHSGTSVGRGSHFFSWEGDWSGQSSPSLGIQDLLSACTLVIVRLSTPFPRSRFILSGLRSSLGVLSLRSAWGSS